MCNTLLCEAKSLCLVVMKTPWSHVLQDCRRLAAAFTWYSVESGIYALSPTDIHMELDSWRYVTQGRGTNSQHEGYKLYSLSDMSRLALPDHWWYYLSLEHGQGHAVKFPLKIKQVLSQTLEHQKLVEGKLVKASRVSIEKLSLHILRQPCDID